MSMRNRFSMFARHFANALGTPYAFVIALAMVVVWALLGPVFGFSSDWQLVINTATTIITFLVVFLIQTTQNRDSKAIHLKLDELIHSVGKARNKLIDAEDLTEEELESLEREFRQLRKAGGRTSTHSQARKLS